MSAGVDLWMLLMKERITGKTEFAEAVRRAIPGGIRRRQGFHAERPLHQSHGYQGIYEAVGSMGFQTGNILEPAMGVGNFFRASPAGEAAACTVWSWTASPAECVELYPKADTTVAGFETTDRRDFFDLRIGNVPLDSDNDRPYNKLGFSIHDSFSPKTLDQLRPGGA